jgi:hypothetical protein
MSNTRQLELFPKPPRTFVVDVDGYGDAEFMAASPGKARYMAYRAFCDSIARWSFHQFLTQSRVRRAKQGRAA